MTINNRFEGRCEVCDCYVAAYAGKAVKSSAGKWKVRCAAHVEADAVTAPALAVESTPTTRRNAKVGECTECGGRVEIGAGSLWWEAGPDDGGDVVGRTPAGWRVTHLDAAACETGRAQVAIDRETARATSAAEKAARLDAFSVAARESQLRHGQSDPAIPVVAVTPATTIAREITVERVGRRSYLRGDTYAVRGLIRSLGATWDEGQNSWWVGSADKAERIAAEARTAPAEVPARKRCTTCQGCGESLDRYQVSHGYRFCSQECKFGASSGYDSHGRWVQGSDD